MKHCLVFMVSCFFTLCPACLFAQEGQRSAYVTYAGTALEIIPTTVFDGSIADFLGTKRPIKYIFYNDAPVNIRMTIYTEGAANLMR